jgi:NADH:ubiquinone oxidoreductase subunit 5 (subunit L)/multisubunit Na+/H+ antiporter MnhA subunit
MISLVLSSNMFQTYVFANIVGILTYLFINFYSKNFQVSKAAKRFLIFDRIGDAMFLAGLIIILYFVINYPIYQSEEFLSYTSLPEAASDLYVYLSDIGFYSVCLLFLISALIKTAQFPFQNVMIDSSEAPLPVCILIQTATNVAIGIFICIRLLPLFNHSELLLETIICLSLINVLICSFFAVAQENIKKMLAYSTSAQFGLMFLSIGLLLPNISLFYLLTHSVAKALLFIVVGLFIKNSIDKCGDFENIKIERKGNPLLVCSYIVSIVSLAGICFGGFFAKEALFENIQILNSCCVSIIFSLAIFMNTYYLFKSYFKIFKHNETTNNINVSISDKSIMITLTLLVVFATYLISQDLTFDSFKDVISSTKSIFSETSLLIIAFVGALLAYGVTIKKWESLPPIINNFARNGGYMNKIFDFICDNIYEPICLLFKKIDKYFINTIYSCFENITKTIAWVISYSQTGNIQSYFANAIFVIIVILVFCLLITVGIGEG